MSHQDEAERLLMVAINVAEDDPGLPLIYQTAQVEATLELADQQRAANIMAFLASPAAKGLEMTKRIELDRFVERVVLGEHR